MLRSNFSVFCFVNLLFLMAIEAQSQPTHDAKVLEEMISFNEKVKTDRLVVSINDTTITDITYRGKANDLFLLYSITKVFSGIAVGILIDQQQIPHPEVPVANFFPEWKNDSLKQKVTIRHILNHTSGLAANSGSKDIDQQPDFVQYALNSSIVSPPGEVHFYNNKAINIISGIVKKITQKSLEEFIKTNVFSPLGITNYKWEKDKAGNTWGMDGLWMNASDLLKIGQLLCNYGTWNGQQILSRQWCELMFQIPLVNSMNGKFGYAMAIRSIPILEQISITAETIDTLKQLGLSDYLTHQLKQLHTKDNYKYPELGEKLKTLLTTREMEEISSLAAKHMIPVYKVLNENFFIKHGGEYGLLLMAFPKRKKVVIRFLGEKWGRQRKDDDSDYKYLVDDELLVYMLKL